MKRLTVLVFGLMIGIILAAQESPAGIHSVARFGAKGNGERDDTEEIQEAIDHCADEGGYVWFPPGTYLTGTLKVKSGVELRLGNGAVLKYTNNGQENALLVLDSVENVVISGSGKLVSGEALSVLVSRSKNAHIDGLVTGAFRLEQSTGCRLIKLQANNLTANRVNNCQIDHCRLHGGCYLNGHMISLSNSYVESMGAGIVISSDEGRGKHISISNCKLRYAAERETGTEHWVPRGIEIRANKAYELSNVSISQVQMEGFHTAFGLECTRGSIHGVHIKGLSYTGPGIRCPYLFNAGDMGQMSNISLENIRLENSALPKADSSQSMMGNLALRQDLSSRLIPTTAAGLMAYNVQDMRIDGYCIKTPGQDKRPAMELYQSQNPRLENISLRGSQEGRFEIGLENCQKVEIDGIMPERKLGSIVNVSGKQSRAIRLRGLFLYHNEGYYRTSNGADEAEIRLLF